MSIEISCNKCLTEIDEFLNNFGLFDFESLIFLYLYKFIFKIYYSSFSPSILNNYILFNKRKNKNRNYEHFIIYNH